MAPLPEAPPAIATLEPAPDVVMAEPPDSMELVVQDEPLPDLPEEAVVPDNRAAVGLRACHASAPPAALQAVSQISNFLAAPEGLTEPQCSFKN